MPEQHAAQPHDSVAQRAARVLDRCVIGPVDVPEHMRPALLRVGVPVRDPSEDDGEAATGVMLALGTGAGGCCRAGHLAPAPLHRRGGRGVAHAAGRDAHRAPHDPHRAGLLDERRHR